MAYSERAISPMTPAVKPMRQAKPTVAAFIDALRAVYGAETIDASIRAGIDGMQTFHASENGRTVGSAPTAPGARFTVDQLHLDDFPSVAQ